MNTIEINNRGFLFVAENGRSIAMNRVLLRSSGTNLCDVHVETGSGEWEGFVHGEWRSGILSSETLSAWADRIASTLDWEDDYSAYFNEGVWAAFPDEGLVELGAA